MNYFPTHLALGRAFCNRKEELNRVLQNLKGNNPLLLMAARRYGKTSLAVKALEQLKLPYVHLDLYKELTENDIEKAILSGVGKLLGKLEKRPKQLLMLASDFFSHLSIKVGFEKTGISLDFSKKPSDPAHSILSALEKLHSVAEKMGKRAIFFIDEFQVVGEITKKHAIEAAIREAVQKSTYIAYAFSGSNRHLLEQIFCDKKRPFYKLCDIILLNRISEEHYINYIQVAAQEKWKKNISQDVLNIIFKFSERHPYYLNKLCGLLWMNGCPSKQDVIACWRNIVLENKSVVERELSFLAINQRKLMIIIAQLGVVSEPLSKDFSMGNALSTSSIAASLNVLIEKDYVYKNNKSEYMLVDPLIRHVLCLQDTDYCA